MRTKNVDKDCLDLLVRGQNLECLHHLHTGYESQYPLSEGKQPCVRFSLLGAHCMTCYTFIYAMIPDVGPPSMQESEYAV